MKAKTIEAIIAGKFKKFLDSIDNEELRKDVEKNTIVTGGCITSLLLNEKVNDFDLYFTNRNTVEAVARYYVDRFKKKHVDKGIATNIWVDTNDAERVKIVVKSAGIAAPGEHGNEYQYFETLPDENAQAYVSEIMNDPGEIEEKYSELREASHQNEEAGYHPVFLSTNAITLSGKIQLVLRVYGDAESIHENYDFVHCTNYWTSADKKLVLKQPALEAILAKELRYVGSKYPLCSIIRTRKFIQRGWTINAGQYLKMVMQLQQFDLNDIDVLQDQLTGVDAAYFMQVIDRLKEKDSTQVDSAYLIEIINRMF